MSFVIILEQKIHVFSHSALVQVENKPATVSIIDSDGEYTCTLFEESAVSFSMELFNVCSCDHWI